MIPNICKRLTDQETSQDGSKKIAQVEGVHYIASHPERWCSEEVDIEEKHRGANERYGCDPEELSDNQGLQNTSILNNFVWLQDSKYTFNSRILRLGVTWPLAEPVSQYTIACSTGQLS